MADDEWFAGGDDDAPPPVVKPLGKKAAEEEAPPPAGEAPAGEGEAPAEGGEGEAEKPPEEAEEAEYLDPNKLILFKHWIRPRFLQYKCIYDYRKNYYDDVMEALNSRCRGVRRNIPPAQTWAERMCRLRADPLYRVDRFDRFLDDVKLVTKSEISGSFYNYYSKEQFNRRYSKLLF
ncbi:unnamed protein product [Callosobruchus maculatus]|uniref:Flightin n=1 Tax=Callosobruchus maculatus TaxID=64391 RepID=A0A653C9G2_CALMS|nr:unnamed protein product [Callosobruchus maculatus]